MCVVGAEGIVPQFFAGNHPGAWRAPHIELYIELDGFPVR